MTGAEEYVIEPADPSAWERLAEAVADLPLMKRYGRDAVSLSRAMAESCGPGGPARILCAQVTPSHDMAGLVWFHETGTFGMGGYLKLLAVFPGHERRGLGLRLLRAAERAVVCRSPFFFLLVTEDNEPAIRFYERAGYVRGGRMERLVLPDADELVYYRRL